MLRKLIASVLLILSALPFTAPFATVDMPTLLGERASTLPDRISLTPAVEDGSHALVASGVRLRVRLRSVLRVDTHLLRPHDRPVVRRSNRPPLATLHHGDRPSLSSLRI